MAKNTVQRLTITLRDARGMVGRSSSWFHYDSAVDQFGNVNGLVVAFAALSNAALVSYSGPGGEAPAAVTYGTAATFESVEDKAVLVFQTAVGSIHKYQVPAPLAAIFLADTETVDPSNAAVATLVGIFLGNPADHNTSDRAGNPLTNFVGGYRRRVRLQRRANIFTLGPTLIPQEPEGD